MSDIAIIVCGGRDYADRERVFRTLERVGNGASHLLVMHGGARGADSLAHEWVLAEQARYRRAHLPLEVAPWVAVEVFRARWDDLGKRAGPERNRRMLTSLLQTTHPRKGVVAFPGGRGTADMVAIAREAGLKVLEVSRS